MTDLRGLEFEFEGDEIVLLNFVLLSSIVLTGKQRLCLKRFLPMSFRLAGLYLLWL